ncbi:hypothetical protein Ahia01_001294300, partial [Argonauta hians]
IEWTENVAKDTTLLELNPGNWNLIQATPPGLIKLEVKGSKSFLKANTELDLEKMQVNSISVSMACLGARKNIVFFIKEKNEFAPTMNQSKLVFTVRENEKVDSTVGNIKDAVMDEDFTSSFLYNIVNHTTPDLFYLDGSQLKLKRELDYETLKEHKLSVNVSDDYYSIIGNIQIKVEDVDDNGPRFTNTEFSSDKLDGPVFYECTLSLNESGHQIEIFPQPIKAVDFEKDNYTVKYSILDLPFAGNHQIGNYVTIDNDTGSLKQIKEIPESAPHTLPIYIKATEQSPEAHYSLAVVAAAVSTRPVAKPIPKDPHSETVPTGIATSIFAAVIAVLVVIILILCAVIVWYRKNKDDVGTLPMNEPESDVKKKDPDLAEKSKDHDAEKHGEINGYGGAANTGENPDQTPDVTPMVGIVVGATTPPSPTSDEALEDVVTEAPPNTAPPPPPLPTVEEPLTLPPTDYDTYKNSPAPNDLAKHSGLIPVRSSRGDSGYEELDRVASNGVGVGVGVEDGDQSPSHGQNAEEITWLVAPSSDEDISDKVSNNDPGDPPTKQGPTEQEQAEDDEAAAAAVGVYKKLSDASEIGYSPLSGAAYDNIGYEEGIIRL